MDFDLKISLSDDKIIDLLSNMMVGADYWAKFDNSWKDNADYQLDNTDTHYGEKLWNWLLNGGSFKVTDIENGTEYIINLNVIKNALTLMAEVYPYNFADIVIGDSDSRTGDLFLQCCCFHELIKKNCDSIYG